MDSKKLPQTTERISTLTEISLITAANDLMLSTTVAGRAISRSQASVGRIIQLLALAAAIGVTACAIVVLCGRLAAGIDPEKARAEIARNIAEGAIPDSDAPQPFGLRGPHPFNECLIYMMAALQTDVPWHDAVSPLAPLNIVLSTEGVGIKVCEPLAEWAQSGQLGIAVGGYGRYLHGHRLLAALALYFGVVRHVPVLLSLASYLLLGLVVARNVAGFVRTPARDTGERSRRLGLLIGAVSLLLFYGMPSFSRLLSHAPADLGLFAFLLLASERDFAGRSARQRVVALACFGAWAASFEFLSGPLPMLIAAVMLVHGLSPDIGGQVLLRRLFLGCTALLVAFAATFMAKQGALLLLDQDSIRRSVAAVLRWIGDSKVPESRPTPSIIELFNVVRWKLLELYGGNSGVAYALALLAVVQVVVCGTLLLRKGLCDPTRLMLLIAPLLVVAGWYAALPNHTVIHVNFMIRLTVWLPLVGWVLTGFLLLRIRTRNRGKVDVPAQV